MATHAKYVGFGDNPFNNLWSDAGAWASGKVPSSSDGLDIKVDVSSTEDIRFPGGPGTALDDPFIAKDVIGASVGLSPPPVLFIQNGSYLSVRDISNFTSIVVGIGGASSGLNVRHDLTNISNLIFAAGGDVEVGHDIGTTGFLFESMMAPSTLILDKPPSGSLDNRVDFAAALPLSAAKVELGDLAFNGFSVSQNPNGSETIKLTNHGRQVYALTDVTGGATVANLAVGVDRKTGNDFLEFQK